MPGSASHPTDPGPLGDAAGAPPRRHPGRPRHTEPSAEYQARMTEIVETAARVFREKGYDAGSLDDVAGALGLRKGSLYYYVRSKAELLYLVFNRAISRSLDRLDECEQIEDPRDRLAALIRHQAVSVAEEPSFFSVFFDQRPRLAATYETEIRVKERHYLHVFAEAVAAAVKEGTIIPVEPRYGAQALLGMTSWVYKWFEPGRDDIEQFVQSCVDLLLCGGRATNGRRPRSDSRRRAIGAGARPQ